MGKFLLALLKTLNLSQIVAFVFMTAAPYVIGLVVKDPALQLHLISLASSIGAALLVILRKPSAEGGTVVVQERMASKAKK